MPLGSSTSQEGRRRRNQILTRMIGPSTMVPALEKMVCTEKVSRGRTIDAGEEGAYGQIIFGHFIVKVRDQQPRLPALGSTRPESSTSSRSASSLIVHVVSPGSVGRSRWRSLRGKCRMSADRPRMSGKNASIRTAYGVALLAGRLGRGALFAAGRDPLRSEIRSSRLFSTSIVLGQDNLDI
jgi:hypothetical protein